MSTESFIKLSPNKQLDELTKVYLAKVIGEHWLINSKMNTKYFMMKNYLKSKKITSMTAIYQYILETNPRGLTFAQVMIKMPEYFQSKRDEVSLSKKVENIYDEYNLDMLR